MTEITEEVVDEQKLLGESSIKSTEKQIKSDEFRLPDELLHRTSMDIKVGIQNVAKKDFGSKKWTIYRVDKNLKKLHDEATFHPKLISIGPFHHNKSDHLKPMEDHKWRFLSRFLNSMKPYSYYDYHREIRRSSSTTTADYTDQTSMKIQVLVAKMENLENEARACYSETFDDLGSKEFVMMMVLDGCFIIELLILFDKLKGRCRNGDDPIFTSRSVLPNLMHDLLLLENQLPFQVLEEILKHKAVVLGRKYKLTDLTLNFFNTLLFRENKVLDVSRQLINNIPGHHHLLALSRSSFHTGKADHSPVQLKPNVHALSRSSFHTGKADHPPVQPKPNVHALSRSNFHTGKADHPPVQSKPNVLSSGKPFWRNLISRTYDLHGRHSFDMVSTDSIRERPSTTVTDQQPIQNKVDVEDQPADQLLDIEFKHMSIHCVTELREAGVEFKKRDNHHHDLLDIEFKGGKLYIPTLYIDDSTSSVFLNFIAYEQRNHSVKPNFTSYLMFLDSLVNSSKDVEHLRYKRIIDHGLGSYEDVATMFHKICKDVVQDFGDDNYLSQVFKDVNKYFGKRRNRWRAAWKHDYFRNPWAFSSFLAAVILLVLTFLQAFFSMYAYFHPPS